MPYTNPIPGVEKYEAQGTYGDRKVRCVRFRAFEEQPLLIVLLHGAHGCASEAKGNKYGFLGRALSELKIGSFLIETSRKRRDRARFGEDQSAWARAAFEGKTFFEEIRDVASGLELLFRLEKERPVWLWGFSLGGLIALSLCGRKDLGSQDFSLPMASIPLWEGSRFWGLCLSGSGDALRRKARWNLSLPILDSLPPKPFFYEAARGCGGLRWAFSFYGSEDDMFSMSSCQRLLAKIAIPPRRKRFHVLSGVDHSFNLVNGRLSRRPLKAMIKKMMPTWSEAKEE